ncbi:hypothetical protein D3OALGA1CA_2669 [Olavius algarvensis associated proteobacterium Delta 3]|nr:hypothetical protein D3OALGA1CA_2669 [Olavius algarvensis associated proteobacterium Delta 3]
MLILDLITVCYGKPKGLKFYGNFSLWKKLYRNVKTFT